MKLSKEELRIAQQYVEKLLEMGDDGAFSLNQGLLEDAGEEAAAEINARVAKALVPLFKGVRS